ncbi:protein PSK SIMULATOR 1-like [Tasmannia lanceolata]|uniref:protein PSK SIMULATOR 1-like n=1 Tax=Tasmannia lanceolata TaxID=3420 RepID=UPI004063B9C0
MVNESWFSRLWGRRSSSSAEAEKATIGVLAFEIGSLMSKIVHLWNSLSDEQVVLLRDEILNSEGVKKLVSEDEDFLLGLALAEMIDGLGFAARSVVRLGKRCSNPVLQGLDHVFEDLIKGERGGDGWEFNWKKMRIKVKKMERFVSASANLYQEMEVLVELEQSLKRMRESCDNLSRENLVEFQRKVVWQRQEVKYIRENSLWNRSYDYVVRILVRSLFTIFGRIKYVFGIGGNGSESRILNHLPRSQSISVLAQSSVHPSEISNFGKFTSGPLGGSVTKSGPLPMNGRRSVTKSGPILMNSGQLRSKPKWSARGVPFVGCMTGSGIETQELTTYTPVERGYSRSNGVVSGVVNRMEESNVETFVDGSSILNGNLASLFSSKRRLFFNAPPLTLGAAALAPLYANIIIIIEKLVSCPHLIAPDTRDDLYNMLPTSIRAALRARLKSYTKNLASSVYDASLAADWNDALERILKWLAPLAHNMIRWQSERNFEQQHLVSKTNVLLLQTLFFANQTKTEAVITELLVGLNYLCRIHGEFNPKTLLEATSSLEFDDYLEGNV